MRKVLGFVVIPVLLAAGAAQAQAPAAAAPAPAASASGFSLGARVGYGIPMGDIASGDSFSNYLSGQLPLQADVMYRIDKNWSLGLYFQYGFAFVSDTLCPTGTGVSCSGTNIRFGGQVMYRFDSTGFLPWIGLGLGGEWSTMTGEAAGVSIDLIKVSGFEYLNLQFGGDWALSPNFRLGPYVLFSLSQFDTAESPLLGIPSQSIADKAMHEWLQLGLKGTFDF